MKKNVLLTIVLILAVFSFASVFGQVVKARPKTHPQAASATETKTDTKASDTPEAKNDPAAETDTKADPPPETKTEAKADPIPEAKAEAKPEIKPEVKPEVKPEPKIEAKTDAKPETTKPVVKAEAPPVTDTEIDCGLLAEESKLDAKIKKTGVKEAFSEFFSRDASVVASTVIEGKAWLADIEDGKKMVFKPFSVKSSSLCDYGYVVGDWEESKGGKVLWGGQYVNVWEKVKGGWKIRLHAKSLIPRNFKMEKRAAVQEIQSDYEKEGHSLKSVSDAENGFFKMLRDSGWAKVYDAYAGEDILQIRQNSQMLKGKRQVFVKSVLERGYLTGKTVDTETAKGGDIAFVWGSAEARGPQPHQKGSFLHVWTRGDGGGWKLDVDFLMLAGVDPKKSIL
jgi:ketosteroid isomerase-like protein